MHWKVQVVTKVSASLEAAYAAEFSDQESSAIGLPSCTNSTWLGASGAAKCGMEAGGLKILLQTSRLTTEAQPNFRIQNCLHPVQPSMRF